MKSLSTTAFVALLIGGLQVASPASSAPAYIVVPLGSASIPTWIATGVNDKGQVCGYGQTLDFYNYGFVSGACGGGVKLVGDRPGYHSGAGAINNSGQIAGEIYQGTQVLGFVTGRNGYSTNLLPTPANANTEGLGINGAGQVCGDYYMGLNFQAFLTSPNGGAIKLLAGPDFFNTFANAVNDHGQVAGYGIVEGNPTHAFLSAPDGGTLKDLGVVFGDNSAAHAVNNSGQVAGNCYESTTHNSHAFVSDPNGGSLHDIGTLGVVVVVLNGKEFNVFSAEANGINDSGTVVGGSMTRAGFGVDAGFIYKNGQMVDLNTLIDPSTGIHIVNATGISNDGFICGAARYGTDQSKPTFAVLLIPRATHLAAPTALTATGHNTTVALHWTASPGAQSYAIYRSTTAGVIGDHPIDADIHLTSYTDTGRKNGVKYYYAIRAEDQTGLSNQSAPASATPHS